MSNNDKLVADIVNILPQLQCKKCKYQDCKSYAEAVIFDKEDVNKCEPGGLSVIKNINKIKTNEKLIQKNKIENFAIANIDVEECIGCTICIKVCPVDAIIGARHQQHYIINNQCNGCELCISECPVDCMDMRKNSDNSSWVWPSEQSKYSKYLYYSKLERIENTKINIKNSNKIKSYVKDALIREQRGNQLIKEYE